MSKCKKCEIYIENLTYYCSKCKKELAGEKRKKSRDLCVGCRNDFYNHKYQVKNPFGGKGCGSFKTSKVIIMNVYHSLNQVVPIPKWRLNCFLRKY